MRLILNQLVVILLSLMLIALFSCQKVEKPAVNGQGELALKVMEGIPAPDYHKPQQDWIARHRDLLKKGEVIESGKPTKITQDVCLGCHNVPDEFCNRCHNYVGVKKIQASK
jgi:hypothetical protein